MFHVKEKAPALCRGLINVSRETFLRDGGKQLLEEAAQLGLILEFDLYLILPLAGANAHIGLQNITKSFGYSLIRCGERLADRHILTLGTP